MSRIEQFERMLAQGHDGALLRFSLGNEYLGADDPETAVTHLQAAVTHDPGYSAAWKALGKARERTGDPVGAAAAYDSGIGAADHQGDKQAAKEMRVFRRRLDKQGS